MAASVVIPKERLSAYERWELGSFDTPRPKPVDPHAELAKQVSLQAHAEGYRAGHQEGLQAGRLEGYEAGRQEALAELAPRAARMDEILGALTADLGRVDRELAQDVVQLGLAVARNLVTAALKARPEIVQSCVEDALRQLGQHQSTVYVAVNPEDAALVREVMEASSRSEWSLKEDARIARGGCRVENAAGEIDATLEQRWHRTTAALGQPLDWVE
jgi:flagellar assembly protein FliH